MLTRLAKTMPKSDSVTKSSYAAMCSMLKVNLSTVPKRNAAVKSILFQVLPETESEMDLESFASASFPVNFKPIIRTDRKNILSSDSIEENGWFSPSV